MKISIIIPILNEANTIGRLLQCVADSSSKENIEEVIVVDGGSVDGSQEIVKNFVTSNVFSERREEKKYREGMGLDTALPSSNATRPPDIKLFSSKKGRAKQMNTGAKAASAPILYFLHADSLPPKDFDRSILEAIKDDACAGCFRMKFDSKHPVLRFSQWFTRFNVRGCRGGDQSLFIKRSLFETLNGFDESYMVYEDCEFIGRLYDVGTFRVLPDYVTTSARKYRKNGAWTLQYHFTVIHLKKFFGASPEALFDYYSKNIAS